MKYISLTGVMALYGRLMSEEHRMVNLSHSVTNKIFQNQDRFTPFSIKSVTDDATGQPMKQVTAIQTIFDCGNMVPLLLPPILEVEWLKGELKSQLNEETANVLEQLSYLLLVWILSWEHPTRSAMWVEYLSEQDDVVIEVEDLADTPVITAGLVPQNEPSLPKIKSWSTIVVYGQTLSAVFHACLGQSLTLKEMYLHTPFMLAMFMRDYHANHLGAWTKKTRLGIENELLEHIRSFASCNVSERDVYTYGTSSSMTVKDMQYMSCIFGIMHEKLHELNADIGLISYTEYSHVRGPETIKASVRLSDMDINWREEIARAAREKARERGEEPSENESDDDEYDEYDDEYDDGYEDY